jgi:hypothetical protein
MATLQHPEITYSLETRVRHFFLDRAPKLAWSLDELRFKLSVEPVHMKE